MNIVQKVRERILAKNNKPNRKEMRIVKAKYRKAKRKDDIYCFLGIQVSNDTKIYLESIGYEVKLFTREGKPDTFLRW